MPRWITIFGRVNHLSSEPGTQAYSAWVGSNEYLATAGEVNRHIAWRTSPCSWSCSVRWMPGWWLASRDQCRLAGSGSALEVCSQRCAIQMAAFTYFTYLLYCSVCSGCMGLSRSSCLQLQSKPDFQYCELKISWSVADYICTWLFVTEFIMEMDRQSVCSA